MRSSSMPAGAAWSATAGLRTWLSLATLLPASPGLASTCSASAFTPMVSWTPPLNGSCCSSAARWPSSPSVCCRYIFGAASVRRPLSLRPSRQRQRQQKQRCEKSNEQEEDAFELDPVGIGEVFHKFDCPATLTVSGSRTIRTPADYKSAIQQITNLRYDCASSLACAFIDYLSIHNRQ